jgi:hypothetical protein
MNEMKVKTIQDFNTDNPEVKLFSKIDGKLCKLKLKVFSSESTAVEYKTESELAPVISIDVNENNSPEQKEFSAATIRERVRMAKFSVRQRFRRMIIDYKKFNEMTRNNMSADDFKIVRGLFTSDVMNIMNTITPDIMKGKQINTLLGLSAFGKDLRVAGQELQIPYRMAMNEEKRLGSVTKMRYQRIQSAYNKFIDALLAHVFGEDYKSIGLGENVMANKEMHDNIELENNMGE